MTDDDQNGEPDAPPSEDTSKDGKSSSYDLAIENGSQFTLTVREIDLLLSSLYQMQSTTFASLGAAYLALHDPSRAKEKLDETLEMANHTSERIDLLFEAIKKRAGGSAS